MGEFSGKVVMVTGGSKGIGRTAVRHFCREGATCIIVSRHQDECQRYADELIGEGFSASGIAADVGKVSDIRKLVSTAIERHGAIDVLVNSAGVNIRKPCVEYQEEDWDYIININLKGSYFTCAEVGKHMVARGSGAIVNVASLQSHIVLPNLSIYAASKAGMRQYTKGLANEWATLGVRVNTISPAFISTDLVAPVLNDPVWRKMIDSRTPMKRPGTPDEAAELILFLASSRSSYITGADIPIDGGWTAG
jgi:NAD(P)-dependent dehydrogenase (short-subunit alcohol dehydrogenase family)